jgi:aerobic carbon-monoxide dehydrogenase medium subunit
MPNVLNYHRPETLESAVALLQRDQPTVVLGGGSHLIPTLTGEPTDVVDLQALGLRGICEDDSLLALGAMATFADVAACEQLPGGVRELARREAPSTLRTLATVGGLVASGDPDSELLAAFLVMHATVTVYSSAGRRTVALDALMATGLARGEIIVHVNVDPSCTVVSERTVRTGMDRAIVAIVGSCAADGSQTMAATGMASVPTVFVDSALLKPPSDFRGTASYRSQLAAVLTERVRVSLTR